jgi:hypothetical protein
MWWALYVLRHIESSDIAQNSNSCHAVYPSSLVTSWLFSIRHSDGFSVACHVTCGLHGNFFLYSQFINASNILSYVIKCGTKLFFFVKISTYPKFAHNCLNFKFIARNLRFNSHTSPNEIRRFMVIPLGVAFYSMVFTAFVRVSSVPACSTQLISEH